MKTFSAAAIAALILLLAGPAAGQEKQEKFSVKDILELKKAGYRDEDLMAEIERSGSAFDLSDRDREELRKAGAGDALLGLMSRAGWRIAAEDVVRMTREGRSEAEILEALRRTRSRFRLTDEEAAALVGQGVGERVVREMRESGKVTIARIVADLEAGAKEAEVRGEAESYPDPIPFAPQDWMRLKAAGASEDFRQSLKDRWEYRGMAEYRPPTRFFRLFHPAGWKGTAWADEEGVQTHFSPDAFAESPAELKTDFKVVVSPQDPSDPLRRLPPAEAMKRRVKARAAQAPDAQLRELGPAEAIQVAGLEGMRVDLASTARGAAVRSTMIHFAAGGIEYTVEYSAPEAEFEALRPEFEKTLASFRPGTLDLPRRGRRKEAAKPLAKLIEESLPSVVFVTCRWEGMEASGSGFVVREDGYVLTNAHVVLNLQGNNEPPKEIEVQWDDRTGLPGVRAELVGAAFSLRPNIDVALLKIPGTNYRPVDVSLFDDIREGDPILTMGFPKSYKVGHDTVASTQGIITKYMLLPNKEVNEIVIDAAITHGNSGGPCFDLATGGVIGLNSFGMAKYDEDFKYTYNGVVPVLRALHRFPSVLLYTAAESARFSAKDHLQLGTFYRSQQRLPAARIEFAQALEKDPKLVAAWLEAGRALEADGSAGADRYDLARRHYETALTLQEDCFGALMALGFLYARTRNWGEAIRHVDRAVARRPLSAQARTMRSTILWWADDNDAALADARKAQDLGHALSPDPYALEGDILFEKQEFDAALASFDKAAEIDPLHVRSRIGRIKVFLAQKKDARVDIEFTRLSEALPDDPEVHRIAGSHYFNTALQEDTEGNRKAWAYYERALKAYQRLLQDPPDDVLLDVG
ncbi:MAG: trypsin-like peptidase domain-containing protein, partial [Planctomycetes bacterium]|nr:trypsin-like peptidase domain-containing protein [Planctomycetota bacterium]